MMWGGLGVCGDRDPHPCPSPRAKSAPGEGNVSFLIAINYSSELCFSNTYGSPRPARFLRGERGRGEGLNNRTLYIIHPTQQHPNLYPLNNPLRQRCYVQKRTLK